jgi:hypothetical protein
MTRGIHLVWTTYGTWLPGDPRGHLSPLFDVYGGIEELGGKLNLPDPDTHARSVALMREAPRRLTPNEVCAVADENGRLIATTDTPAWAAAVEPNHVHLLVGPVREPISRFAGRLKGRTSSEVRRLPGNADRRRVWTEDYWKVFLFDGIGVRAVKAYIDAHNTRAGLPPAPFDWLSPIPSDTDGDPLSGT